uniref:Tetratricopeptide repeat protein 38 n=1 Tax=Fagus sylvatica TaxID=28930 RepID=A0A2N9EC77_FAGSY
MEGVKLDMWGYEVRTSSDSCISAINSYYHQVCLSLSLWCLVMGERDSVILEALVHDKDCVLANILAAHFLCYFDPSRAPNHFQAARSLLEQATKYEKAVFDAISYLKSEDRDDDVAVELHSKLLKDFPRDLVSLQRAQVLCFYMNRADLSLDLAQQVLTPVISSSIWSYVICKFNSCAMYYSMSATLRKQWSSWKDAHLLGVLVHRYMLTHNWWHVALCYLEGNSPIQRVLEVYDHCIWKELEKSDAACPEVHLNALGLLLRLYVRGEIDAFEDRLKILAGCLTDEANWYLEWHFDSLTIWALASTGKLSKAEALLNGLKSRFSRMSLKKQQLMQRGMLLAEALYEYGRGNEKQALELLGPDFDANNCKAIGASNEQADVFNEVWYSMLLNTGQAAKAIEVIEKRIKKREGVPFLWCLLERGYNLTGRKEAAIVGEKARALETTYFK